MAHGRKRIEIWKIDIPNSGTFKVPLYMITNHEGIHFEAIVDELGIRETHAEPDKLKKAIKKAIGNKSALEWTSLLRIRLDAVIDQDYAADWPQKNRHYARVEVTVIPADSATRADGTAVNRNYDYGQNPPVREGTCDSTDDLDDALQAGLCTYVTDTKENRLALDRIATALESFRYKLTVMLMPDRVRATLQELNSRGVISIDEILRLYDTHPLPTENDKDGNAKPAAEPKGTKKR